MSKLTEQKPAWLWAIRCLLAIALMGIFVATGDPLLILIGSALSAVVIYQFVREFGGLSKIGRR